MSRARRTETANSTRVRTERGKTAESKKLGEVAEQLLGPYCANGVHTQLRGRVSRSDAIDPTELGVSDGRIAFENGVLDLETHEFSDLEPEDHPF